MDILTNIFSYNGSVNFYMFHGGTNFGFMNGDNHVVKNSSLIYPYYTATVTSYGEKNKFLQKLTSTLVAFIGVNSAHGPSPKPTAYSHVTIGR